MFTLSLGKTPDNKISMFVLKSGFFKHTYVGCNCPQSLHVPLQTKLFTLAQSKVLWTKVRGDIRPHASKHYWSGISRFIL